MSHNSNYIMHLLYVLVICLFRYIIIKLVSMDVYTDNSLAKYFNDGGINQMWGMENEMIDHEYIIIYSQSHNI